MKKVLLFIVLGFNQQLFAAATNATNKATASLVASCSIKSEDLTFGNISLINDTFSSANITSMCTKGTVYKVGVDLGSGGTGTSSMKYAYGGYVRFMKGKNSSDKLAYNVFQDNSYSQIFGGIGAWGGGQGYPVVANLVGTGSTQITTMYGALAPQFVTPDIYQENTTVSVQF